MPIRRITSVLVAALAAAFVAIPLAQQTSGPCAPIVECTPMGTGAVAWLKSFAGQPGKDATEHSEFKHLVSGVAPDVTYHLGNDVPLVQAIGSLLTSMSAIVQVRSGRYAVLAGCRTQSCANGRGMLWVDLQSGLAIGAIEFNPTNGEPTPTLTIFSSHVGDRIAKRSQLPAAFLTDLDAWSRGTRLRGAPVRYFINASGWKSLILHDEDACQGGDRSSLAMTLCATTNLEGAEQDMQAAAYLLLNTFSEGSLQRDTVRADQDKWLVERSKFCTGSPNDPATASCRLKLAKDRAQALTSLYNKQVSK